MSTRYPHNWAPGYTADGGEIVGHKATPSGKLLHICQRCGAESPAPCKDQFEGDCPGAMIQERARQRPESAVEISDVAARVMHTTTTRLGACYVEHIDEMLIGAAQSPGQWTERMLRYFNLVYPREFMELRSQLLAQEILADRQGAGAR